MMRITEIRVHGDHDTEYTITDDGAGEVQCSCPAFKHGEGKPCKHMKFVAAQIVPQMA